MLLNWLPQASFALPPARLARNCSARFYQGKQIVHIVRAVSAKVEVALAMDGDNVPRKLGRYEVRGKIGEGGMATVYFATDPSVPQTPDAPNAPGAQSLRRDLVALKVIKSAYSMNNEFVTMFTDEAQLVSQFDHPSIVRVYELAAEGSRLFIAMEFLRGQSLWSVWNACRERGVRLRYDVAAWVCARVAEGLHYAHEARNARGEPLELVHRDVNASNIFVTYDGQVKVIDFGLAKAANKLSRTRAGMVKGKLAYMSPEQAVGRTVDRRTDIFALGISLWECTVDRRLFKGPSDAETLERVHAAFVPDPRELVEGYPDDLWDVVRRSLERNPDDRFADARTMAAALDRVAQAQGRGVNSAVVGGIMHALFAHEIAEQDAWVDQARRGTAAASGRTEGGAVLHTMRPGPSQGERMARAPEVDLRMPIGQPSPTIRTVPQEILSSRDFAAGFGNADAHHESAPITVAMPGRPALPAGAEGGGSEAAHAGQKHGSSPPVRAESTQQIAGARGGGSPLHAAAQSVPAPGSSPWAARIVALVTVLLLGALIYLAVVRR